MARFDRLTDLLSSLGEKNLKIRKVILVKFGSLLFAQPPRALSKRKLTPRNHENCRGMLELSFMRL